MSNLTQSRAWQALNAHRQAIAAARMDQWFAADPQRFRKFSLELGDLLLDYSKNLITAETIGLLVALATERGVAEGVQRMFGGEKINTTEKRAVLHTALRGEEPVQVDGNDVMPEVRATLARMREFCDGVRSGAIRGKTGARFTDVVSIGIGGSHLGPALVCRALAPYATGPRAHFVSNVDGAALQRVLDALDAASTLVVIISKTFTTVETLTNARSVRAWLENAVGKGAADRHCVAVTANTGLAREFGIPDARVFPFWDWVGGRYSLWSAVGLPVAVAAGMDAYAELLRGAHAMDGHFRNAPLESNMPAILALLGLWYNNFFGAQTHAILPYDESLALLPAYLQQLDMESSGKRVTRDGRVTDYDTGAIIWGAPGTDAQHSFFQLLHQGTRLIPADFIGVCEPQQTLGRHHAILMANFFAQTEALMNGAPADVANNAFPGNRPSNSMLVKKLTPHTLGMLIALYEHKVFVQNAIWGTNAFDQPGVELGKQLAARILPELESADAAGAHDASTRGLVRFYKAGRRL